MNVLLNSIPFYLFKRIHFFFTLLSDESHNHNKNQIHLIAWSKKTPEAQDQYGVFKI